MTSVASLPVAPREAVTPETDPESLRLPWHVGQGLLCCESVFGRSAPLDIVVGSGRGRFLASVARTHPERNFLGIEISAKWSRIGRIRCARQGLSNVHVVSADARLLLEFGVSPASVDRCHIDFPDPWPRRRHRDRRLVTARFLDIVAKRLVPGGELLFATDVQVYFDRVHHTLQGMSNVFATQVWEGPPQRMTNFAAKYHAEGRSIYQIRAMVHAHTKKR